MCRRTSLRQKIKKNVKVCPDTGCWNWQGGTSGDGRGGGYGRMRVDGATMAVHRVMYIIENGPVPRQKQIDHICSNRACCNPDHLEMVTHKQNQKRRDKRRRQKT
jgi:hypothetical protein